jgi:MFS transporter, BCD family, chlorophyll transporter
VEFFMSRQAEGLSWPAIARLGVVQAAIGSIVVIATSTLNRVMVVELALPAVFPGLLVALHYVVQMSRTRVGHGSDTAGSLTSWIIGGMIVLAIGGVGAAGSVALMTLHRDLGIATAIVAYVVIGLGAGACGTSLLVLLAKGVAAARRPAAATVTWLTMFVGFVITTAVVGLLLDPYSSTRLIAVTAMVAAVDVVLTIAAIWNVERRVVTARAPAVQARKAPFREALAQVWHEPTARQFTLFVFISMLAYSGQELILEPFAARTFGLSPGQSARIASLQHGGALLGMLSVALLSSLPLRWRIKSLRSWTVGGCIASAIALIALALSTTLSFTWPLRANVFVLGLGNGVFAVAAIGSMMSLVSAGGPDRQGLRMGLWGAAQAVAFAFGGAISAACVDLVSQYVSAPAAAYAVVFTTQAVLFVFASALAAGVGAVSISLIQAQKA